MLFLKLSRLDIVIGITIAVFTAVAVSSMLNQVKGMFA